MKSQVQNPNSIKNFDVFVDQHSPEQAHQIERQWRKKNSEQKSKCYTKLMVIMVIAMLAIFIFLINFIDNGRSQKKHVELYQITYKNSNYVYLQSNYPHLKFLIPTEDESTPEIRMLRSMGILYAEVISWIQANVQSNMKVLYVPNENSRVNILGIALGYYLRQSNGGQLTMVINWNKYFEMTTKNIELMNDQLSQKMPMNIISIQKFDKKQPYDLIVLENNIFYKQIYDTKDTKIIMIRREGTRTSIMSDIFTSHTKYQIVKGLSNFEIRQFPIKYGYSIIPYQVSEKIDNNNILLIPQSKDIDVEMCQQQNSRLVQDSYIRNLVQYMKNKTLDDASLYYQLENIVGLEIISTFSDSCKFFAPKTVGHINKTISIDNVKDMARGKANYFVVKYASLKDYVFQKGDYLIVEIDSNSTLKQFQDIYASYNIQKDIQIMSPFNNKGCYYPPTIVPLTSAPKINRLYFALIQLNPVNDDQIEN